MGIANGATTMIQWLRNRKATSPAATHRLPAGQRAYAIGDVHGRLDLLIEVLRRIEADDAARPPAETHVILLGDLVDRGAASAQTIEYLRAFRPDFASFHFVMGNHEAIMLASLDDATGDPHATGWLDFGGIETLASYGVAREMLALPGAELVAALHAYVPRAHLKFLRGFVDHVAIGEYLFVHAGIRPGVPLEEQVPQDLLWIRDGFLDDPRPHPHMVIHGHTISRAPIFRPNRIGLDTGAYRTGVLTALGLEDDRQWLLTAADKQAK